MRRRSDPPRHRRAAAFTAGSLLLAAALVGGGYAIVSARAGSAAAPTIVTPSLTTVQVTKTDLSDSRLVAGTLGFGSAQTVKGTGTGIVTDLPAVGATVTRGKSLFRVDDQPVVVLFGQTPFFRTLDKIGISGRDVRELRENLSALGYHSSAASATAARTTPPAATMNQSLLDALKRWQKDLGVTEPGRLVLGQAVVLNGGGRVSALKAQLGDPAGGELFTVTATTKSVTVPMSPGDVDAVKVGAPVRITLPDGKEIPGKVTAISQIVAGGGEDPAGQTQTPTTTVTVVPTRAKDVVKVDAASVRVRFTTVTRRGVLAVPVGALVALREGGYALQRPDGSLVAAQTGMFAGGMVQVTGHDLRNGMEVVTTP